MKMEACIAPERAPFRDHTTVFVHLTTAVKGTTRARKIRLLESMCASAYATCQRDSSAPGIIRFTARRWMRGLHQEFKTIFMSILAHLESDEEPSFVFSEDPGRSVDLPIATIEVWASGY
ncbi:MAG: hypothetical protein EXS55_01500 [Candidatus Magasanikbacteria bacterium]|nr:hypothetical protein [Candidatus Magasanikbacteria bacterium]